MPSPPPSKKVPHREESIKLDNKSLILHSDEKNEKSHGHWSRAHELSVTWEIFFATNSFQEIELIKNILE